MGRQKASTCTQRERGETQVGVIMWGLALGILVSVVMTLQSCIEEHKEGKVAARRQQWRDQFKRPAERGYQGYQVKVQ